MTKAGEAEQTAYLFSEQTHSCTAEGEPGKKMALMMLEDIFQHEHATAKKLCNENTWSLNKLGQKECQDKTLKRNLQQNYKKNCKT